VITAQIDASIYQLLNAYPWFYQDEIADFLYETYDIEVSQNTISRALARIKLKRKKLQVEAAQRNDELRTAWRASLEQFTADQLVCVDESGSGERIGDRQYGWAPIGGQARVSRWFARRDRVSVLGAYTTEAYIAAITFSGTCNTELFEQFIIDHLLPLCIAYPAARSVIVMDNASIHPSFRMRLENACRAKGVWIRYLPHYSPDFNPIEESFHDLKVFIRSNYRQNIARFASYQEFLEWAVVTNGSGDTAMARARAHFRNAGIY